ncbi:MAG: NAD-dependent epimerase/dehydratase family protein [Acidimicrobiia bacterium]
MKTFLTGATGVVGRSLVPRLVAAGHDVRAVYRRDDAAAVLAAAGAEPVRVDLFDSDAVMDAVVGSEAVLHLATNVPPLRKAARPKGWAMHDRLRVDATRNLVAAAIASGASHFVKESVTFVYADAGDEWIDERAALIPDLGLLAPAVEGEQLALEFATSGGSAAILRFGLFYGGMNNRGTLDALKLARLRRSTIAGSPDAYMASIHCDDVATAVLAALDVETGIYNVVDDTPMRRGDYLNAFAAAFAIPTPKPTPGRLMKLGAGPGAAGMIASQRVSNATFRSITRWAPSYPDARMGWAAEAASREDITP